MKIPYRAEIDGLRAVSVLGVLFFHLKFDFFSGGYLGVDVFIVISGYLITSLIYNDLKFKKFNFVNFFLRRARRLLPTYLVVLFLSLVISYLIYLPEELINFSKSLISSTFFVSNFFFWLNSGYWDETNLNPLLHTWSLSIEWQFYLFLSFFLYVTWKILKKKTGIVGSLFITFLFSFFLAIIFIDRNISFFLLPFRIYEFLIGSLIYFIQDKDVQIIRKNSNLFSFSAIGLILLSFTYFDSFSEVPGYISLIPCLSTGLLIYVRNSLIHRVLRLKWLVFLGLISYSLYLFHWPIITYYGSIKIGEIVIYEKILLVFGIIIISLLNYFLIERQFRRKFFRLQFFASLIITLIIIICCYFIINKNGYPERFIENNASIVNQLVDKELSKRRKYLKQNVDLKFSSTQKKNILIVGDSLGKDMFIALRENLNNEEFDIEYLLLSHWCFEQNNFINFFSFFKRVQKRNSLCDSEKKILEENFNLLSRSNYVLFSSSWHSNSISYIDKIIHYIQSYTNAKIIVSSKTVEFPDIKKIVIKMKKEDLKNLNKIAYGLKYRSVYEFNKKFRNKVKSLNYKYLDKTKLICSEIKSSCNVYDEKKNELHLMDHHHWTFNGAKYFGSKINFNYLFE